MHAPALSPRRHIGSGPRPIYLDVRAVWLAVTLAAVLFVVWALRDLFVPFAFAAALVLIGAPLVDRLQARGAPRFVGAGLVVLLLFLVLTVIVLLIVPKLVEQISGILSRLPTLLEGLERWIERTFGVDDSLLRIRERIQESVAEIGDARAVGGAVGEGARRVLRGVAFAAGIAGLLLMVPILVFFGLSELDMLRRAVPSTLPHAWREPLRRYGAAIRDALMYMLRGQLIVALSLTALYVVGLSIAGVPFAVAISVIAGLAYFIPFATTPTLLLLSVVFTLLERDVDVLRALLGAAITAALAQAVESWFLTPRIVGKQIGLPPLFVVVAVLCGGELFGFVGILFSVPVATTVGAVVRAYREGGTYEEADDDEHSG